MKVFIALVAAVACAQQVADTGYEPALQRPAAYTLNSGPVVAIDEAHFNFHTATGRYLPFANLVRRDGYVVLANTAAFTRKPLAGTKVLVIANAVNEANSGNWSLPRKSAFTPAEVKELLDWVRLDGGGLLLIADHMPFAGAAMELGQALGLEFTDGYVTDEYRVSLPDMFTKEAGSLRPHQVTEGITAIGTFTGSAFRPSDPKLKIAPILVLGKQFVSIMPETIGKVDASTPRLPVQGWLQGALLEYGKGRVAVFGEAAMFSAQIAGPGKSLMGMNHPKAAQNHLLILNLMRWLSTSPLQPAAK